MFTKLVIDVEPVIIYLEIMKQFELVDEFDSLIEAFLNINTVVE